MSTVYTAPELRRLARNAAIKRGIDPNIFVKQMGTESSFDPAIASGQRNSPAGAEGAAQIMPGTAKAWHVDPLDPAAAYDAAALHDAQYIKQYGGWRNALVAYNAGPGAVGGSLPGETRNYIKQILGGGNPGAFSGGSSTPPTTQSPVDPVATSAPKPVSPISKLIKIFADQPTPPTTQQPMSDSPYPNYGPTQQDFQRTYKLIDMLAPSSRSTAIPAIAPTGTPNDSPLTLPGSAPDNLRAIVEQANAIDAKHYAYEWGGGHNAAGTPTHGSGHGSGPGIGYDCSGVVSKLLGINPRVASQFESFGKAGPGKEISIYAKSDHTLIEINGHFFGTSMSNPGGGAGWIPRSALPKSYLRQFVVRHPNGM